MYVSLIGTVIVSDSHFLQPGGGGHYMPTNLNVSIFKITFKKTTSPTPYPPLHT